MRAALLLAAGCTAAGTTTPTTWSRTLDASNVMELFPMFYPDRIEVAVTGSLSMPVATQGQLVTLDYAGTVLAAQPLFDGVAEKTTTLRPVDTGAGMLVYGRRPRLVEYTMPGAVTDLLTTADVTTLAVAVTPTGIVLAQERTTRVVTTIRKTPGAPAGTELTATSLASLDAERMLIVPDGEGTLVVSQQLELYGAALDQTGQVGTPVQLTTTENPIESLVQPQVHADASGLIAIAARPWIVFGKVTGSPPVWSEIARLDTRARVESIDVSFAVRGDDAFVVIQSDAQTAVPLLLAYRLELATGLVSDEQLLSDGSTRYSAPAVGIAPDGSVVVLARRSYDGRAEVVMTTLAE